MAGVRALLIGLGIVVVAAFLITGGRRMIMGTVMGAEATRKEPLPAPTVDEQHPSAKHETAVFAGGCFWGVQTTFQRIKGVTATTAGYSGGSADTATYDQVSIRNEPATQNQSRSSSIRQDQLRHAAPRLLLRRARPHPAEPPGPRRRHLVPLGHLLHHSRTAEDRRSLHRATRRGPGISEENRHRSGAIEGLL